MNIRQEEPGDAPAALDVERAAFSHGRGGEPADDIVSAVEAIRAEQEGSWGLVAEDEGRVVGHVQFSRAWIGEAAVALLGPIGVLPERQGQGVGSALVRKGLEEARARGERAVILLGDPGFYGRFGFEPAARLGLKNPATGVQPDGFVVREEDFQIARLTESARDLSGEVRWHPSL